MKSAAVERLTDSSRYCTVENSSRIIIELLKIRMILSRFGGTHKERFEPNGKGKGKVGQI